MTFNFDREFQSMMQVYDLNTVILLGHLNPDGDAAGSVMGLAHYIKINYPQYKVLPYLADTLDKGPKKQVKLDKVFNPFEKPDVKEKYAVIVCDTAVLARMIGREYYCLLYTSVYNSTRYESLCLPSYMKDYEDNAVPFWIKDIYGNKVGSYSYIKEALGF